MIFSEGDKMGLDMFLLDQQGLEIGYWGKANQIHNWFVENIQGGIDDCGDYPVTISQLDELIDTIRIIDSIKNDSEITEISYVASW